METTSSLPIAFNVRHGIAQIQFNRPESRNAIDVNMALSLRSVLREIRHTDNIRVVTMKGSGRGFMAGGDLRYLHKAGSNAASAARRLLEPMNEAVQLLTQIPCPVIAAVHGHVAGAGMSLAMLADFCIATETAHFNLAYSRVGNSLDCAASWTLPRAVGLRKAKEIALLSDTIDSSEAHRLGLINFVVPDADLESETGKLAERLSRLAPFATAAIKRQLNESHQNSLKEQLERELASFVLNARTADFMEGIEAFLQKRDPAFQGR